jgi:hypothetical protein
MQQKALERGYEKTPLRKVYNTPEGSEEVDPSRNEDYLTTINPAWAKRVLDEGDGYSNSVLQNVEQQLKNEYYADPSNFIQTRETPYNQGVNTFNEGNEDQKRILDQINTGQLKIVPVSYEVTANTDSGPELRTGYELKDARTGQTIPQQVIPIDPSKGIFNVVADDRNSSGFFNNYVSTDPSGFVNPVVSREQSQYASRKNSSADFYRNSLLASLSMTGLAFPGLGEALGAATGLGTVGGNVALNTGINALKQGITGQFNPLALATSAALSYGMGGSGAEGADPLTADDMYTGQAMTNLASSDDATRLADLVRAFENRTELTGPTIDVASNPTVELGNATVDESLGLPNVPKDLQNEAYLDPGLIDVAPDNVTIATPNITSTPSFDTNLSNTNIGQVGGGIIGSYIGDGTGIGGTGVKPNLSAGELTVSGNRDTFDPWDNPEPPPYTPFEEDFPLQPDETAPLTTPKILSNILKSTPSALPKAIATQQQSNLANILRGSQMPQTALPPIYHQANPFNFGQQALPVQDVSALVKLLRTA